LYLNALNRASARWNLPPSATYLEGEDGIGLVRRLEGMGARESEAYIPILYRLRVAI
jgi:hypothetical protein